MERHSRALLRVKTADFDEISDTEGDFRQEKVEVSISKEQIVATNMDNPKPSSTLTQALTTLLHLHPHPSTLHPHTGYLTKHPPQSQMTLINDFKKEKLKLCKVTPSQFIYSGDTKKTIILTKDTECYAVKDTRGKGDYNFCIVSNNVKRHFSTETGRNRSEWIKAIHRCIPNESVSGLEVSLLYIVSPSREIQRALKILKYYFLVRPSPHQQTKHPKHTTAILQGRRNHNKLLKRC